MVQLDEEEMYLEVAGGVDDDMEVYTVEGDAHPRCILELRKKHDTSGLVDPRFALVMTMMTGGAPSRRTSMGT